MVVTPCTPRHVDDWRSQGVIPWADEPPSIHPASLGLDDGGEVGYLDIGDAVLLVPGGVDQLRAALLDAVSDADWEAARSGFGDPELANE